MTKIIAIVSTLVLAMLGLAIPAPVSETAVSQDIHHQVYDYSGTVEEITDAYILVYNEESGKTQVNIHEDTIFEGKAPAKGDLIHVLFNGLRTRSLPPQINAMRVGCYAFTGAVVELTEEGFTLDTGDDIIQVNAAPELLAGIENGQRVTVYSNGAMTMSLPAQIGAELIIFPAE